MLVSCSECRNFISDTIGSGQGAGKCSEIEDYINKGANPRALRVALRRVGNYRDDDGTVFWGGQVADRECQKYRHKLKLVVNE